jgi:REP element-mobilizing transposase RayT
MPDHLHLLAGGLTSGADLSQFTKLAKQLSAYHLKHRYGLDLWAKGYYDRIVREDEYLARYVEYIRENPVRAGLVSDATDYPFLRIDDRLIRGRAP